MKKRKILTLALLFLLCGCGSTGPALPSEAAQLPLPAEVSVPQPEQPRAVIPEAVADGLREAGTGEAVVDYSHTEEGYVMVLYSGETDRRLKVLLKGPTTTYNYNLPQGAWTVLPLSDGDGEYELGIYRNTTGTKYATVMTASFPVTLRDEFAPFLRPNRYVDYSASTDAVARGAELTAYRETTLEKVAAVYDYVIQTLDYDFEKAKTVESGYIPELDRILAEGKGICFDYAALMTAMLRSQQIPCKLVVGYAGRTYHAWISVWTEEQGWIDGAIFFDGSVWRRMDPTFGDSAAGNPEVEEFLKNGTYTEKYLY